MRVCYSLGISSNIQRTRTLDSEVGPIVMRNGGMWHHVIRIMEWEGGNTTGEGTEFIAEISKIFHFDDISEINDKKYNLTEKIAISTQRKITKYFQAAIDMFGSCLG